MTDLLLPDEFDLPPNRLTMRKELLLRATASLDGPNGLGDPRHQHRRTLVAVAISALLALGAGASIVMLEGEAEVPASVEHAVNALFPTDECVGPAEGTRLVRAELDRLGFLDWGVRANPTNANEPCVLPAFDAEGRTVILVRNMTPEQQQAISAVTERMWNECLDERGARDLLGGELTRLGVQDWSIEVDAGIGLDPVVGDARFLHWQRGCYVLAGSVNDQAEPGAVTYLLASIDA